MIPDSLATQPIFLCVDDTMVAKAGTRFENVSKLFGHAAHNGSNYLNGHCFAHLYGRMTGYLIFHFLLDIACGRKKNQSWNLLHP